MNKLDKEIIDRWYDTLDETDEEKDALAFAEGMGINECKTEGGEKCIYFEEGCWPGPYVAHCYRMGERDGEKEAAIIDYLYECGMEFE